MDRAVGVDFGTTNSALAVVRGEDAPRLALFRRGDSNADGDQNITDAVQILNFLFLGGAGPLCQKSADVDDSGTVQLTDPVRLLNHLFLGGPAPPAPFAACGVDPTEDALACDTSQPSCP